jgi:uncharacterized membrane protein
VAHEMPVDILVASFANETGASDAFHDLDEARKQGALEFDDAAVLAKDSNEKLRISETADAGFGRGAMIGGVAGAAIGVLAGPIGWATLGGAAIGGLATKLHDGGFPDEKLRRFGEEMSPGASALIAIVERESSEQVQHALEGKGARVISEEVSSDLAEALDIQAFGEQPR